MKNHLQKDQLKEVYELKGKWLLVKEISLKTGINYGRLKKRFRRYPTYDDVEVVVHRCQNCGKILSPRGAYQRGSAVRNVTKSIGAIIEVV